MAEETIVKLNGKEWIAREPVAWRLQPDIPLALMQGQNTHADTQGLLEYPVLFRGLMGRWEQRLGRDVDGYWDNQGVLVNDGAAARAIRLVTTSPANMATGADPGCAFCVSDIDGATKVYVVWGDRMYKTATTTWTEVGQVANAKGRSLVLTYGAELKPCLMWAAGRDADIQVTYDGASISGPWAGERADLIWHLTHPKIIGSKGLGGVPVRLVGNKVGTLKVSGGVNARSHWPLGDDTDIGRLYGWAPIKYIGALTSQDAVVRPTQDLPSTYGSTSLLIGRGVMGINIRGAGAVTSPTSTYDRLSTTVFQETLALGDLLAGCVWRGAVALSTGKAPVYLWSPNSPPEAIGPFNADGVPSTWAGYVIRDLTPDGNFLLALVEKGGVLYIWRYDGETKTWDVPSVGQTGLHPAGNNPIAVVRTGLAGSAGHGGEIELIPTGAGTYAEWLVTGISGSVNRYAAVSEEPPDDDETYIAPDGGTSMRILFAMSNIALPASYSLVGVRVVALVKRLKGSDSSFQFMIRSGASEALSGVFDDLGQQEHVPGGLFDGTRLARGKFSYQPFSWTFTVDPATGIAWTEAGVNGMECGLDAADINLRCTWLRAYAVYRSSATDGTQTNRVWHGLGHATTPKLAYIDLPDHGWNPRGSSVQYDAGDTARAIWTPHMGFQRPERQKRFLGVRFHGEFDATNNLRVSYSLDKAAAVLLGTVTADGQFLRFGTGSVGLVGRTLQLGFAPQGNAGTGICELGDKGAVIEYQEVRDNRWLIGPVLLDLLRTAEHRRQIEPEKLFEELEALITTGTLFTLDYADRPQKLVAIAYPSAGTLTEELLEVKGDLVSLWLEEPVPSP